MSFDQFPVTSPSSVAAAPPLVPAGFTMANETFMEGQPWAYNQRIYELWRIWDPWPRGCLLQMTGPTELGVLVQAVWESEEAEQKYMAKIGIDRYTDCIRQLGGEFGERPADVLPTSYELHQIAFGPLADRFADIGADLDEARGKQFGTVLTAVDFDLSAIGVSGADELADATGLSRELPGELILRMVLLLDDQIKETQLWTSEQAAREFADGALATAAQMHDPLPASYREIKRLAICGDSLKLAR